MVAVGALALTATTLLAGCGSNSTASTAAPAASEAPMSEEPAASEAPMSEASAAEAPASAWEGTVKPADLSDEDWATGLATSEGEFSQYLAGLTPERLAEVCEQGVASADKLAADAQASTAIGGTVEEWTQVWETVYSNVGLMACSMAE